MCVLRVFRFVSQEAYLFYPIWRIMSFFRKALQSRKDALLSALLKKYFGIACVNVSECWRVVVRVIPVFSGMTDHRFTVAFFPTELYKMTRTKKRLCNVSSGLGLHPALITEDKNPNTVNQSFINRFGPALTGRWVFFTCHMLFMSIYVFY